MTIYAKCASCPRMVQVEVTHGEFDEVDPKTMDETIISRVTQDHVASNHMKETR